jgi:hypothetical protein
MHRLRFVVICMRVQGKMRWQKEGRNGNSTAFKLGIGDHKLSLLYAIIV